MVCHVSIGYALGFVVYECRLCISACGIAVGTRCMEGFPLVGNGEHMSPITNRCLGYAPFVLYVCCDLGLAEAMRKHVFEHTPGFDLHRWFVGGISR